jgi:hypothetical protein
MSFAKFQTANKALFERLSALVDHPQPFEIARLRQEAKKLLAVDAAAAYQILGGLAAIEFDIEGLHENHKAALRLTSAPDAIANYGVSLQLLGLFQEATPLAVRASNAQPENLYYLRTAVDYATYSGEIRKALELCSELEKRAPDQEIEMKDLLLDFQKLMDKTGVDEHEIRKSFEIAFALLRSSTLRHDHVSLAVDLTTNSECAHFRIYVRALPGDVRKLDLRLGAELANQLEHMHSASLVVDYGTTALHKKLDESHPLHFS